MAEYVEREKVRDMLHSEMDSWGYCADEIDALLHANDKLYEIPAADVAPVVHGRWVQRAYDEWYCDKCGYEILGLEYHPSVVDIHFCEWCGAKMDAEE